MSVNMKYSNHVVDEQRGTQDAGYVYSVRILLLTSDANLPEISGKIPANSLRTKICT